MRITNAWRRLNTKNKTRITFVIDKETKTPSVSKKDTLGVFLLCFKKTMFQQDGGTIIDT